MKDKIKEIITRVLSVDNGLNSVQVVMRVMNQLGPTAFTTDEYHEAYDELLKDGSIIRLEYLCPSSPDRAKTLLFTRGTNFLNLQEISSEQEKWCNNQADLVRESC